MPGARSPALLPVAGKQQVLLQLLQSLLNKVSGEGPVAGMDTLVSSTMLLLLTALRSTYSAAPGHRDIMGGAVGASPRHTARPEPRSASRAWDRRAEHRADPPGGGRGQG